MSQYTEGLPERLQARRIELLDELTRVEGALDALTRPRVRVGASPRQERAEEGEPAWPLAGERDDDR